MFRKGFDNEKYLKEQTKYILERASKYDKIYIECGGKLLHDMHAFRVLPGYDPDVKMKVFSCLAEKIEIIICIHSKDIEKKKVRADFNRTYDEDVLKMIEDFRRYGMTSSKVVITRFKESEAVDNFRNMLERRGVKVYLHKATSGYPADVATVVSDKGFGQNEYIETSKPIVIVTAPGPGSGKLGTCLSQVYHEFRQGKKCSYSKFETFPIWNLPIDHPVNIAYEAATADLGDFNRIDHYELESTGNVSTNYNRDLDVFPIVKSILQHATNGHVVYDSPTQMGVNRCGFGIVDDGVVREAAKQEIIRRYLAAKVDYLNSKCTAETVERCRQLMAKAGISVADRKVVDECHKTLEAQIARKKGKDGITCTACVEVEDGVFVSGTNSFRMHAATAMVFKALKHFAKIADDIDLISKDIIDSVLFMKHDILKEEGTSLNVDEGLICLALSAARSEYAKKALVHLNDLAGLEVHISHLPSNADGKSLKKLKMNWTCEPIFPSRNILS